VQQRQRVFLAALDRGGNLVACSDHGMNTLSVSLHYSQYDAALRGVKCNFHAAGIAYMMQEA
jgi:hypothetical protein